MLINAHVIGTPITTSTTTARGTITDSTAKNIAVVNDSDALAYVNFGGSSVEATSANPAVAPNSSAIFERAPDTDTHCAILLSAGTGFASVFPATLTGN
jgi:hypothetical protein